MDLTQEKKDKLLQIIEDKKNKGSMIKTKKNHDVSYGKSRKPISNKKVGGVFDK